LYRFCYYARRTEKSWEEKEIEVYFEALIRISFGKTEE
jgi:hypothetical protein